VLSSIMRIMIKSPSSLASKISSLLILILPLNIYIIYKFYFQYYNFPSSSNIFVFSSCNSHSPRSKTKQSGTHPQLIPNFSHSFSKCVVCDVFISVIVSANTALVLLLLLHISKTAPRIPAALAFNP